MTALERLQNNRNALGMIFMLPAAVLLILFLTYPLGLGFWLGFTDAKVGRSGEWIGIENYQFLWGDAVTRLALFNTIFYTVVAITLLAGLQTISPSYYEASAIDGATRWQQFRHVTLPLLTPIIAVVMTFSVLFTFTDFQLIYVITRGGPLNATHLMATLSFQRAIPGGALGEGAAISIAMVPFLLAAILFSYFGLQRRAWQQGAKDA